TINYTAVNMELVGAASANYSYSDAAVTFKINPRPVVIAWDADSFPYTGSAQNVTATITNIIAADAANVDIEYNTSGYTDAGNHTTTVADLTGTRAFNYTLTGGTNLSKNWSITKVDPTCTLPTAITGLTYTSSAQVLINAGVSEHGVFEYKLGDGAWTTDIAHYIVGTEAQDYVVSFRFTGDENHNDIAATVIEGVRIAQAASEITVHPSKVNGLVYTGLAQALIDVTDLEYVGGTIKFRLGTTGEWSESVPTAINANPIEGYEVYYKVFGDSDHSDTEIECIQQIIIEKADPVVSGIELRAGWAYNGESNTLITNFGSSTFGTLLFASSENGQYATLTNINVTDAGTYEVWYKVESTSNWNAVAPTLAGTVTVAKANPVVTAPTPYNNLTFTNGMQALVAAGSTTGGELQYKIGDGNWSTAIPTATLANENPGYTVWYRVVGDDNHNDVAAASVVAYIAKADSYVIEAPVEAVDLLYDAQAHALFSNGGTANGGEVQYRLGTTGEWSTAVPTAINAN
ncbi:MAG: hypothetical protein II867_04565, partial [Clostridia bacterium]|nr:hypothetical protein [Clostridia bacterium]